MWCHCGFGLIPEVCTKRNVCMWSVTQQLGPGSVIPPPHMCAAEADIRSVSLICIAADVNFFFFLELAVANQDINPPVSRLVSYRTSDDCRGVEAAWASIDDALVWCSRSNTDMVEYTLQNVDTVLSNQFLISVWLRNLEVFDVAKPWHLAKESLAFRVWSHPVQYGSSSETSHHQNRLLKIQRQF